MAIWMWNLWRKRKSSASSLKRQSNNKAKCLACDLWYVSMSKNYLQTCLALLCPQNSGEWQGEEEKSDFDLCWTHFEFELKSVDGKIVQLLISEMRRNSIMSVIWKRSDCDYIHTSMTRREKLENQMLADDIAQTSTCFLNKYFPRAAAISLTKNSFYLFFSFFSIHFCHVLSYRDDTVFTWKENHFNKAQDWNYMATKW